MPCLLKRYIHRVAYCNYIAIAIIPSWGGVPLDPVGSYCALPLVGVVLPPPSVGSAMSAVGPSGLLAATYSTM